MQRGIEGILRFRTPAERTAPESAAESSTAVFTARYRRQCQAMHHISVNSVSPGLTWENLLTTACDSSWPPLFSLMRSRQSLERPIFWQRGISRTQLHCACENRASRDGPRRFRRPLAPTTPKLLDGCRNPSCAILFASSSTRRRRSCERPDGTKLSKTCPTVEPFKQAARRARCLIFDLELLDVGRLGLAASTHSCISGIAMITLA